MANKCSDCGGPLTQLYDDTPQIIGCDPCYTAVERMYAQRSWVSHFFSIFWFIFHFEFAAALGALSFTIERIFSIGSYNPKTGRYYKKGYLTKK